MNSTQAERVAQAFPLITTAGSSVLRVLRVIHDQHTYVKLFLIGPVLAALLSLVLLRVTCHLRRRAGTVAFFHPYANDGGGGERVLWCAIEAIQSTCPWVKIAVYSGDGVTEQQLRDKARSRFGVRIERAVRVVPVRTRTLLEPTWYPALTMIGQAAGSTVVALECLVRFIPEVWFDTTGWAFPYPLARAAGCRVACYVHYPTVSSDMIERVRSRTATYNNAGAVARSWVLTAGKTAYYWGLMRLYGWCGQHAQTVMVNSSWTKGHIEKVWRSKKIALVYPPCDCATLSTLPIDGRDPDRPIVLSIGQFRPEKDHVLQLRAMKRLRNLHAASDSALRGPARTRVESCRLVVIGSTRNAGDEARLRQVKREAGRLGLGEDDVTFLENLPYSELQRWLGRAACGLHTMRDEHFGISVVEFMAAGAVPIAHASGGPRMDIVVPGGVSVQEGESQVGLLCETEDEYARAIAQVCAMAPGDRAAVARRARARALQFSTAAFQRAFERPFLDVVPKRPMHMVYGVAKAPREERAAGRPAGGGPHDE
ncbi:unnamed protein product [Pedinophyceae sp. YPF-701]|nr:unnamed protein product [Pedinophyceae sp. YPF-701]